MLTTRSAKKMPAAKLRRCERRVLAGGRPATGRMIVVCRSCGRKKKATKPAWFNPRLGGPVRIGNQV
jgi:hypothetical protein